jgi:hypothetical protein
MPLAYVILLGLCLAIPSLSSPLSAEVKGFYILDPADFAGRLGPDLEWAKSNVPFIDVEDEDILTAFYYRWRMYKKHIVQDPKTGRYIVTEFLPKVSWAGKDNTIPAAAGHHVMEGRWVHDEVVTD